MVESITIYQDDDKVFICSSSDARATDCMIDQAMNNKNAYRVDLCINYQIRARWRRYDEKWYRSVI